MEKVFIKVKVESARRYFERLVGAFSEYCENVVETHNHFSSAIPTSAAVRVRRAVEPVATDRATVAEEGGARATRAILRAGDQI